VDAAYTMRTFRSISLQCSAPISYSPPFLFYVTKPQIRPSPFQSSLFFPLAPDTILGIGDVGREVDSPTALTDSSGSRFSFDSSFVWGVYVSTSPFSYELTMLIGGGRPRFRSGML
jgi:hypothetical protein